MFVAGGQKDGGPPHPEALHQTNPEVLLATRLDEEERVAPPFAAEGPRPDGPVPPPALLEAPAGLLQFWATPTQVWGQHSMLMEPYPPQVVWAVPFHVWPPPSGVGDALAQVLGGGVTLLEVSASPPEAGASSSAASAPPAEKGELMELL
ncbi:hypothetical protein M9458_057530, partial [Cirrhinus mrigala]